MKRLAGSWQCISSGRRMGNCQYLWISFFMLDWLARLVLGVMTGGWFAAEGGAAARR